MRACAVALKKPDEISCPPRVQKTDNYYGGAFCGSDAGMMMS
jgi:hypothetical protein